MTKSKRRVEDLIDVMEVNCLERPCGDIRAQFAVMDGRLQLVLESRLPESRRFVLQSFNAKARLD
jgi:hypothetical protein